MQAFDLLGHFELVLGPSRDGGYYLIGLSGFHYDLFVGIAWSTDRVLLGTIGIASCLGIDYHCLTFMADIDDFADLKQYMSKNPETELALSFTRSIAGWRMKKGRIITGLLFVAVILFYYLSGNISTPQ